MLPRLDTLVPLGLIALACSRTPSATGGADAAVALVVRPASASVDERRAIWSNAAVVRRTRELSMTGEPLESDLTLESGLEEWRLLVTCREQRRACGPVVWVTLDLEFQQLVSPDVRLSLRHALRGYEFPEGDFRVSLPADECLEASLTGPATTCTRSVNAGWTIDELARRWGRPNPDESADQGRARAFIARVENRGAPIAARVRIRAGSHDPI